MLQLVVDLDFVFDARCHARGLHYFLVNLEGRGEFSFACDISVKSRGRTYAPENTQGFELGFQFFEYLSFEFEYFANTQNTYIFYLQSLANFEKDNLK
jgi:hypothetical protein